MALTMPAFLLPHTVTVKPYTGTGAYGPTFGRPFSVRRAYVEDRRRLVRASDGAETISETTVITRPDPSVPAGSEVTVWPGTPAERTAIVITASTFDHPSAPAHLEITLT
ncbi:hypothetical protein ACFQ05_11760 [Amycolatopsis umgeniensis]|uniref:Head-to-tail stopper n=1 Tax=Amycolatopsis umgeniensis TaxID=336628 RepID=A0A841B5B3_9PSEU|nr:hypothetical protein [Amycolatopsis umgeniensis]MBB5853975.1 hypothetical protein [Amycolatopsis umgeniensis]